MLRPYVSWDLMMHSCHEIAASGTQTEGRPLLAVCGLHSRRRRTHVWLQHAANTPDTCLCKTAHTQNISHIAHPAYSTSHTAAGMHVHAYDGTCSPPHEPYCNSPHTAANESADPYCNSPHTAANESAYPYCNSPHTAANESAYPYCNSPHTAEQGQRMQHPPTVHERGVRPPALQVDASKQLLPCTTNVYDVYECL
jgi:hypothetical protein